MLKLACVPATLQAAHGWWRDLSRATCICLHRPDDLNNPGQLFSAVHARKPQIYTRGPAGAHVGASSIKSRTPFALPSEASGFMHVTGAGLNVANLMIWTADPSVWILARLWSLIHVGASTPWCGALPCHLTFHRIVSPHPLAYYYDPRPMCRVRNGEGRSMGVRSRHA